jgi:hypothetical protein
MRVGLISTGLRATSTSIQLPTGSPGDCRAVGIVVTQDVDRPGHIERQVVRLGRRRASEGWEAEDIIDPSAHCRCGLHTAAVQPIEHGRSVIALIDRKSPFVYRAMMPPAQQREIVEAGRSAISPVPNVMAVAAAGGAAGKPAVSVARQQRAPDGGRDRPGLSPHVEHGAVAGRDA